jgi:hypothetical protein
MFGKLICRFKGHKRGKRVMSRADAIAHGDDGKTISLYCPRCGAQWTRKAKAKAP